MLERAVVRAVGGSSEEEGAWRRCAEGVVVMRQTRAVRAWGGEFQQSRGPECPLGSWTGVLEGRSVGR
jgi:hypothetical protein